MTFFISFLLRAIAGNEMLRYMARVLACIILCGESISTDYISSTVACAGMTSNFMGCELHRDKAVFSTFCSGRVSVALYGSCGSLLKVLILLACKAIIDMISTFVFDARVARSVVATLSTPCTSMATE